MVSVSHGRYGYAGVDPVKLVNSLCGAHVPWTLSEMQVSVCLASLHGESLISVTDLTPRETNRHISLCCITSHNYCQGRYRK